MDVECGNVKYIPTAAHYNSGDVLFFQVALVGGPMRRDVAIRWTNRKRDGTVWHVPLRLTNAQNSHMLPTTIAMSNDV